MSKETKSSFKLAYEERLSDAPIFKAVSCKKHVVYSDVHATGNSIDNFPNELLYLKNNSVWHGTILDYKIRQVFGRGFMIESSQKDKPQSFIRKLFGAKPEQTEDFKKTVEFLKQMNEDEDGNEVLLKVVFDKIVFGGFTLLITWSRNWKTIESIEHIAFDKVRSGKVNAEGKIENFYYSYDWRKQVKRVVIPVYNKGEARTNAEMFEKAILGDDADTINALNVKENTQIFCSKGYNPSSFYYPLPSYIYSLSSIRADINSDRYGERILKNGMAKTTHINLVGNYSPEEFEAEACVILDNHTGAESTGMPFITHSKTKETAPEIAPAGGDSKEDRYTVVNETVRQKILSGHGLTSGKLAGISEAGSLGTTKDEALNNWELFIINQIQPIQFEIAKVFNKLLDINGLDVISIDKLEPFESMLEENNTEIDENSNADADVIKKDDEGEEEVKLSLTKQLIKKIKSWK